MVIIETRAFTSRVDKLLDTDEYRLLQRELIIRPDIGKIIQNSAGLRKFRWAYGGKGKSGGARICYYWHQRKEIILLLFIFTKNEQANLTKEQLKILRNIIKEEYK